VLLLDNAQSETFVALEMLQATILSKH